MNLHRLLQQRCAAGKPIRVGLIGAGKFGSMFLNQVPTMPGLEVPVIADIDLERARAACRKVGWDPRRIDGTRFVGRSPGTASLQPSAALLVIRTLPQRRCGQTADGRAQHRC
jgi:predicted homoserine dehydrogenase-like protein